MTTAVTDRPIQPIANVDSKEVFVLTNQTDIKIQKVKEPVFSLPGTDLEDQSVFLPSPRTLREWCSDEVRYRTLNTWLAIRGWFNKYQYQE